MEDLENKKYLTLKNTEVALYQNRKELNLSQPQAYHWNLFETSTANAKHETPATECKETAIEMTWFWRDSTPKQGKKIFKITPLPPTDRASNSIC